MTKAYEWTSPEITEDWLRRVGFKWHQLDRQPDKHWLLWIGDACRNGSFDDFGIELAPGAYNHRRNAKDEWFVWFRADHGGRYTRFLHLRHVRFQHEIVALFEGLTCTGWDPSNHIGGNALTPRNAERYRQESDRLDRRLATDVPWSDRERDESRGRALPEHLDAHAAQEGKP